jgi:polyisoprenoid-binding protein YceI
LPDSVAAPYPKKVLKKGETNMSTAGTTTTQSTKPTEWNIDPAHSAAHFSVRHLMISNVRGEFSKLSGTIVLDPADLTRSTVEVSLDTSSVNTREAQRDEHLRSADFFDVANHPTMTFRSRSITANGPDNFKLTGDLTIRGVTREVTFDVEGPTPSIKDPWGNLRAGIIATAKINRKDFGMVLHMVMEGGGVVVGDTVSITIEAELVQKAPAAPAS